MAVKVFNNRATFLLVAEDGETMTVPPLGFCEIPDKFTGDITYRKAVQAGVMQIFTTSKQAKKIEEAAQNADAPKAANAKASGGKAAKGDSK